MKKRRIILLICVGLVSTALFSCEFNEVKKQAKINELENELESQKEKEKVEYQKKIDDLMKEVEKMKELYAEVL